MASFLDEVKSGRLAIYAQYSAIFSLVLLLVLPFLYIFSSGLLFIWAILAWTVASFIIIIEFPVFSRCLPSGSALERFFASTRNYVFRTTAYALFSIVLWLSWVVTFNWLLMPAFWITITTGLYLGAMIKKEEQQESIIKGGSGISDSPPV